MYFIYLSLPFMRHSSISLTLIHYQHGQRGGREDKKCCLSQTSWIRKILAISFISSSLRVYHDLSLLPVTRIDAGCDILFGILGPKQMKNPAPNMERGQWAVSQPQSQVFGLRKVLGFWHVSKLPWEILPVTIQCFLGQYSLSGRSLICFVVCCTSLVYPT